VKEPAAEDHLGTPVRGPHLPRRKRWNTRIGSSELSTVTAEPRRIFFVRAAIAASTTLRAAEESRKSARVMARRARMKSMPSRSARTPSSITLRITCACGKPGAPSAPRGVTSPNVSSPNSRGLGHLSGVS